MKPQTITDTSTVDTLATDAATVATSALRECMVLMDPELGTPLMWLDHKLRTVRGSATHQWLAHNLETGRLETVQLGTSARVAVLAA